MKPAFLMTVGTLLRGAFGGEPESALPAKWVETMRALDRRIAAEEARFGQDLIDLSPRLKGFARSLTRDDPAAEDLVQETMLRAWKARRLFTPGTSMRAWTFTILKRLHVSNGRRQKFVGSYDDELERSLSIDESQSVIVALKEVQHALELLPEDQRNALWMVGVDQLSYEEAAARMNVAIGTIKSRVARGRQALIVLLETGGNTAPDISPLDRWRAVKATGRHLIG